MRKKFLVKDKKLRACAISLARCVISHPVTDLCTWHACRTAARDHLALEGSAKYVRD